MRRVFVVLFFMTGAVGLLGQQDLPPVAIAKISFAEPVHAGMPIWMHIESASDRMIRYPSTTTPNDFHCNEVELRQEERLLPPLTGSPAARRGCGWLGVADGAESRLPIHLQYPVLEPGIYLVRFTRREFRGSGFAIAERSQWTPLHLQATPPEVLEKWIEDQLAALPENPGRLLGDALPSLLASRDERVLRVMIETSYHPEAVVAAYAANSLALFDPEQVRARVVPILRRRGPSVALAGLFATRGSLVQPVAAEIVEATLPYLRSSADREVEAALRVLSTMRDPYFEMSLATVTRIGDALQASADFIISQRNEKAAWVLANFLGSAKPPAGRRLLWKLVEAKLAVSQSLSCITWFQDPTDLPRLAEIAGRYDPSDPHGYAHSGLVGQMRTQYGPVARPYLRDLLSSSKQTWVRTAAAKELLLMNDSSGWEFFVATVKEAPFYRDELVRWLQDRFPTLRNADDRVIIAFLESMIASADR